MNYGELKQAVIDDAHRQDLLSIVFRFIRQCEGMIRRDLIGMPLRSSISEINKTASGRYSLPAGFLQMRSLTLFDRQGDALQQVAPAQIKRLSSSSPTHQFCIYGNNAIELRGYPGVLDIFEMTYYGTPAALVSNSDENDLLTNHETLYMAGSKFFLYLHTQDRELAADELDIFNSVVTKLNDQISRKIGGASIAPSYNFSGGSSY